MAETSPLWLTVAQANARCGLGPQSKVIYLAARNGELRAARIGSGRGALRFHPSWLDAWMESRAPIVEDARS